MGNLQDLEYEKSTDSKKDNIKKSKNLKQLVVCGYDAIKALAKHNPQKINKFYFDASRQKQFPILCKYLAKNKKPYNLVETSELEKLSSSIHHQGVVAFCDMPCVTPLTRQIVNDWITNCEKAIILDCVGNASNLGAIIRSAAFFGIKNIVMPLEESQSSITTSSYRVAQGGMEEVNLFSINSISAFLKDIKGRMVSIAATLNAKMSVEKLPTLIKNKAYVIVLGNEEYGIKKELVSICDYSVMIKSHKSNMQSLNVAQAASILFYICTLNNNDFNTTKSSEDANIYTEFSNVNGS